ncbi:hypothetical protein [Microbulbifer sp. PSTR4-B]|uniref:hypothetical protein n=1 Tax=unclassified Microbulbifer TaxID=2619833 RepID=UPI00403AEFAA
MISSNTPSRQQCSDRAEIEEQVAAFLAGGKSIQQIPRGQSGEQLRVAPGSQKSTSRRWAKQKKNHLHIKNPDKKQGRANK